jgi:hypothetical protein
LLFDAGVPSTSTPLIFGQGKTPVNTNAKINVTRNLFILLSAALQYPASERLPGCFYLGAHEHATPYSMFQ